MIAIAPPLQAQFLRLYGPPVIQYGKMCPPTDTLRTHEQKLSVAKSLAAKSGGLEKALAAHPEDFGFSEVQFLGKKLETAEDTVRYPQFSSYLDGVRVKARVEIEVSASPVYSKIWLQLCYDPDSPHLLTPKELEQFLNAATPLCEKTLGRFLSEYQKATQMQTGGNVNSVHTVRLMTSAADLGKAAEQIRPDIGFTMSDIFSNPSQFDPFFGLLYLTFGCEVHTPAEFSALTSARDVHYIKLKTGTGAGRIASGLFSISDAADYSDLRGIVHAPGVNMPVNSEKAGWFGKQLFREIAPLMKDASSIPVLY